MTVLQISKKHGVCLSQARLWVQRAARKNGRIAMKSIAAVKTRSAADYNEADYKAIMACRYIGQTKPPVKNKKTKVKK